MNKQPRVTLNSEFTDSLSQELLIMEAVIIAAQTTLADEKGETGVVGRYYSLAMGLRAQYERLQSAIQPLFEM